MSDRILSEEEAGLGSLNAAPAQDKGSQHLLGIACLLVTAVGWALNWPGMKIILHVWPPLFSRGMAGVVAALALAVVAALRGQSLKVPRAAIPRLLAASLTNVLVWMGLSTVSMRWVSVAEGALLVYTMPIWASLFAWPILGAKPNARGFLALVLGLAGVVVLLGGSGLSLSGDQAVGAALALTAAICFALGTVLNGKPLPLPPITSTAWQVGLGCLPMLVAGALFEHPHLRAMTPVALGSLVYMTVFPMGICYLTWFAALRRLSAATASTAMLLVPVLGTLSAVLLLGETLGLREILAMLLTLSGVTLALGRSRSAS
ncbi:DMT family transporter [Acidisoma cellulosilytica]|uniref:DMT family transporter n=1 Tax=Acidisoma cellulosilyticum TaxID=2802395 RepID=A0A964E4E9_9PROT|nr:DMT family transporter [Acidisoma cellulosilyticum]MCB8881222.1 DMT family transporter [Acidisoma cellulosilyticum]